MWPRIRSIRLRNDLMEIRIMNLEALLGDSIPRAQFEELDELLTGAIDYADRLTLSIFFETVLRHKDCGDDLEYTFNEHPSSMKIGARFANRMGRFLFFETFSGVAISVLVTMLMGWKKVKALCFDEGGSWARKQFLQVPYVAH